MTSGAWVLINDEPCPKCGRKGDHGERKNDLCWRCNLPDELDAEEHKALIPKLRWERENLYEVKYDAHMLTTDQLIDLYGCDSKTILAQVRPMIERNARDLVALDPSEIPFG